MKNVLSLALAMILMFTCMAETSFAAETVEK